MIELRDVALSYPGRPLFEGDRSHFYDQLCDRGLTVRRTVLLCYLLGLLFAVSCALLLNREECDWDPIDNKGGALDKILLSEKSDEAGPLVFNHWLHYAGTEEGGMAIRCQVCHHDYKGLSIDPPKACRVCHLSHDDPKKNTLPTL